jgi:hypothetical protein
MPKFFTLSQAEKLLPQVESAIRETLARKLEYERAESDWVRFSSRVTMQGGMQVDRGRSLEQKKRRESAAEEVKAAIERVQEYGCLVKDLDIGLIDFPTLLRGQEVYLCWKLGESGIQFWHGVHEGFRGRKAIDKDFLAHHQGGPPD